MDYLGLASVGVFDDKGGEGITHNTGAHCRIYTCDDEGNVNWYGFYPIKGSHGGSSSGSSVRTSGPGYVNTHDKPTQSQLSNGKMKVRGRLSDSNVNTLINNINNSVNNHNPYNARDYNCSTWAKEMLVKAGIYPDTGDNNGISLDTPDSVYEEFTGTPVNPTSVKE
jgi:hypothetical protein